METDPVPMTAGPMAGQDTADVSLTLVSQPSVDRCSIALLIKSYYTFAFAVKVFACSWVVGAVALSWLSGSLPADQLATCFVAVSCACPIILLVSVIVGKIAEEAESMRFFFRMSTGKELVQ